MGGGVGGQEEELPVEVVETNMGYELRRFRSSAANRADSALLDDISDAESVESSGARLTPSAHAAAKGAHNFESIPTEIVVHNPRLESIPTEVIRHDPNMQSFRFHGSEDSSACLTDPRRDSNVSKIEFERLEISPSVAALPSTVSALQDELRRSKLENVTLLKVLAERECELMNYKNAEAVESRAAGGGPTKSGRGRFFVTAGSGSAGKAKFGRENEALKEQVERYKMLADELYIKLCQELCQEVNSR